MMRTKNLLICLFLLLFAVNIHSQIGLNKLAQSTMNFLLVSTSPKASAMGEAFFAAGSGAEGIFYNPSIIHPNLFNAIKI